MPIHNLDKLFYPHSVAVVGATNRDNEPGNFVMHNLLQGGFEGPIMPVTDGEHPKELEEEFVLPNGLKVLLRPIRPEDARAQHEFHDKCTPQDMELRFFHRVRTLSHLEMARLTQIDYDREMAFIATTPKEDGSGWETLGAVRTFTGLHNETAEYAILVRSDIKRQRLGRKLMEKMVRYCRSRGTRQIVGHILCDNKRILDLIRSLGFKSKKVLDENIMEVVLDLQQPLRQHF